MERYDIAIIGTGPAGISAAITAKVRNKNIILFGTSDVSEKVKKAHKILNYPALPNVDGETLHDSLKKHLEALDITITKKKITAVYAMGEYFALASGSDMYEAKTVIVATGVSNAKEITGESKWLGRGVSYCATCDGMFYKGKKVAVIAYNEEAENEAIYLADIAKEVIYFKIYKKDVTFANENIKVINEIPKDISGIDDYRIIQTDSGEYKVDGIFILRDSIAPNKLVAGIDMIDNHIKVDVNMQTNIAGCYACGDVVGKPYQYVKSAGQGNTAAILAVEYLAKKERIY